jgi:hypothetical protein
MLIGVGPPVLNLRVDIEKRDTVFFVIGFEFRHFCLRLERGSCI